MAAAEDLNFRRAASRLHIAQPALSVQIKQLETELKVKLFQREGRGVVLTEAGTAFMQRSRKVLDEVHKSVAIAQLAAQGEVGQLTIGHNGPAELLVFPQAVPAFQKKYKQVHLSFESFRTLEQVERVRRGELDVGFVWSPLPQAELDVAELMTVPLVAVLNERHPLARRASVSPRDLATEPMVLFQRSRDWESYHQLELLFMSQGVTMNVRYELEMLLSVMNFVSMGMGCSIIPNYDHRINVKGVVYRPLQPTVTRTLAAIKKQRRSGLAAAFYEFVRNRVQSPRRWRT